MKNDLETTNKQNLHLTFRSRTGHVIDQRSGKESFPSFPSFVKTADPPPETWGSLKGPEKTIQGPLRCQR